MSRYSRCPHQNASGTATLAPLHQPQLRNPWVATDRAGESQSTNSSSSSRTYRGPGGGGGGGGGGGPGPGPGPPPPLWHAPPPPLPADHFNHHPIATHPRAAHYLVDHQLEVLDGPGAAHAATHLLAPPGPGRPPPHAPQPQPYAASSRAASERDRPVTPASSPGGASGSAAGGGGGGAAAVDGCGGHCVAFENFCYRLLQVIFIAGILTGISLTIAGSVLRHAPSRTLSPSPSSSSSGGAEGGGGGGRDKAVLVYIGCLVGLVCALLLAVQCCVRRNVKRRKRALRMSMAAAAAGRRGLAHAHAHAHASVGTLPHPHAHAHAHPHAHAPPHGAQQGPVHLAHGGDIPLQELQYQPLLVRLVQQQATAASSSSSGNQRLAAAAASAAGPAPAHYHRPGHAAPAAYRDDLEDLDASCSGTPWWRRRGDPRHTRQPHVADTRR